MTDQNVHYDNHILREEVDDKVMQILDRINGNEENNYEDEEKEQFQRGSLLNQEDEDDFEVNRDDGPEPQP